MFPKKHVETWHGLISLCIEILFFSSLYKCLLHIHVFCLTVERELCKRECLPWARMPPLLVPDVGGTGFCIGSYMLWMNLRGSQYQQAEEGVAVK